MERTRPYLAIIKPGIVLGNSLALVGGFGYGVLSGELFTATAFVITIVSTALVIASACIVNNIFDRNIDMKMARTRKRAIPSQVISIRSATIYATALFVGAVVIGAQVNRWVVVLGVVGWALYAFVYTYLKRRTYHATLIGAIPGALPPVIGYVGSGGESLWVASILFFILVAWQMVHFYAIALFRKDDYASAGIPVITLVRGEATTYRHIAYWHYLTAFLVAISTIHMPFFYTLMSVVLIFWWVLGLPITPHIPSSRRLFVLSLKFLFLWTVVIWASVVIEKVA